MALAIVSSGEPSKHDLAMRRIIGNTAMLSLLSAGILIFIINGKMKSSTWRYHAGLARALWKIETTTQSSKEKYNEFCWSWRKLLLAAVMVASLVMICLIRTLTYVAVIGLGVGTVGISWAILWILWFVYFLPLLHSDNKSTKPTWTTLNPNPADATTTTEVKPAEGWDSKYKQVIDGTSDDRRLPVTIVTGFLGSGKTTLIKRILNNTVGLKILVIENEIGAEGIDHDLLLQQTGKEEIILMNNGCICCTVRKDVLAVFHKLFADASFSCLNWVVIETTGVADPSPLIQTLYMDDQCRQRMRLDSVLAVVDSKHLPIHIAHQESGGKGIHGNLPEAVQQLMFADRILINKCDLVSPEELDSILRTVSGINSAAQLLTCQHSNVPLTEILNIRAFDASKNKALLESTEATPSLIQVDADGKILKKRVNNFASKSGKKSTEESVYSGVTTISLVSEAPLDLNKFNEWLSALLREYGNDLYRLKGILHMQGYDHQFVAHGVHMLFDGEVGKPWGDGPRSSKLVLIGRNLKPDVLKDSFNQCCSSMKEAQ
jgi:G3E family GTPase